MFSQHPIYLHRYLTRHKNALPANLNQLFYLSWEDALWDVIKNLSKQPCPLFLLPDFFCVDVIHNMVRHGVRYQFYQINPDLQVNLSSFIHQIQHAHPDFIVILNVAGIRSNLFNNISDWLPYLPNHAWIVEDCVHQIINPSTVHLITENHLLIDSLRKVVPLVGSRMIGSCQSISLIKQSRSFSNLPYLFLVIYQWLAFQFYLHLLSSSSLPRLARFFNQQAFHWMIKGYDLIGDSQTACGGPWVFSWLASHLNYNQIEQQKIQQVKQYQRILKLVWKENLIFQASFTMDQAAKLRGLPIVINLNVAENFLILLKRDHLAWKYELEGCPWSNQFKLFYLPLGPHLSSDKIELISQRLKQLVLTFDWKLGTSNE